MIDVVLQLSFLFMILGYLISIFHTISQKQFKKTILIVIIPFYVFYYILKLSESKFKKILAITCIGNFWVFFFAGILKIVFTPPV